MTDTEYLAMIEAEWNNPTDEVDLFDDLNSFEESLPED